MSDTQRTDALREKFNTPPYIVGMADVFLEIEKLERELAEARDEIKKITDTSLSNAMSAKIMESELIEARKDSRRLDWLDEYGRIVKVCAGWEAWNVNTPHGKTSISLDVRDAIDEAMQEDGK